MSKLENVGVAAKALLESVSASFGRVSGAMRETSAHLDASLGRIRAIKKVA